MNYKVSVLFPVRDQIKYLHMSIRSILSQTYQDFEILLIDDGSVEDVDSIVNQYKDPRIRYYKNDKNIGAAKTINKMMDLATGDIFARQDTDDISKPNRFAKQVELFKKGHHFVTSKTETIDSEGKITKHTRSGTWINDTNTATPELIKRNILNQNYIVCGASMRSRKVFETIGYKDTSPCSGDYNYWIRILNYFDVRRVEEVLYSHRKHPDSWRTRLGPTKVNYHDTAIIRAKKYPILREPENEHLP